MMHLNKSKTALSVWMIFFSHLKIFEVNCNQKILKVLIWLCIILGGYKSYFGIYSLFVILELEVKGWN
jgi:hypothetical protein